LALGYFKTTERFDRLLRLRLILKKITQQQRALA
jgi:hypothetical protein